MSSTPKPELVEKRDVRNVVEVEELSYQHLREGVREGGREEREGGREGGERGREEKEGGREEGRE